MMLSFARGTCAEEKANFLDRGGLRFRGTIHIDSMP
jgi:hypothetical protein